MFSSFLELEKLSSAGGRHRLCSSLFLLCIMQEAEQPLLLVVTRVTLQALTPSPMNALLRVRQIFQKSSVRMQLTDAMTEAKDTHRYLKRLDEVWEPLYQDLSIGQMQQLLPGLLSSIRTMQTVCRCPPLVLRFLSLQ